MLDKIFVLSVREFSEGMPVSHYQFQYNTSSKELNLSSPLEKIKFLAFEKGCEIISKSFCGFLYLSALWCGYFFNRNSIWCGLYLEYDAHIPQTLTCNVTLFLRTYQL